MTKPSPTENKNGTCDCKLFAECASFTDLLLTEVMAVEEATGEEMKGPWKRDEEKGDTKEKKGKKTSMKEELMKGILQDEARSYRTCARESGCVVEEVGKVCNATSSPMMGREVKGGNRIPISASSGGKKEEREVINTGEGPEDQSGGGGEA